MHSNFTVTLPKDGKDGYRYFQISLSESAFIDPYEIQNIKRIVYHSHNKPDLEAPVSRAHPNENCFIVNGTDPIVIPFHLRYHTPSSKASSIDNKYYTKRSFQPPLKYYDVSNIKVVLDKLSHTNNNNNNNNNNEGCNERILSLLLVEQDSLLLLLPIEESNDGVKKVNKLELDIPVGIQSDEPVVSLITLLVSTLVTLFLLLELLKKKK